NHLDPVPGVAMAYEWNTGWGSRVDYDMAMCIIVIKATDERFVTGSVNGDETLGSGATERSAVMNLVVDPNTLGVISDDPFLHVSGHDNRYGPSEYGVDLVQAGGTNYVLANMAYEDWGVTIGAITPRPYKQ